MKALASILMAMVIPTLAAASPSEHTTSEHATIPATDARQIDQVVRQYYALSHTDASCYFSPLDENGFPADRRIQSRAYRDERYSETFKPLFSHRVYVDMKKLCVDHGADPGMLDYRLSDSEIDSDASHYGNGVRMKVARPLQYLETSASRVRVRVDWLEMLKGLSKPDMVGRSDVILVKEDGAWRIDDVYSFGVDQDEAFQFDMSTDDFERLPGVVHLRGD